MEELTAGAIRHLFQKEVKAMTVRNTYMGMWQLHAVASILQTELFSIYPEFAGQTVHKDLNKLLQPRNGTSAAAC